MKPAESPQPSRLVPQRCAARAPSADKLLNALVTRTQQRTIAGLVGIALLLGAGGAFAQGPSAPRPELPLELEWSAPPDCASPSQVKREVERMVRARPGFSLPSLAVNAVVQRTSTQYRVRLELTSAGQTTRREFQSESCNALVRAATLSIALAFGDGAEIDEASPPEEQEKPAKAATSPAPAQKPEPAQANVAVPPASESAAKGRRVSLAVGAAWSPSLLGGSSFGMQAFAALRWPHLTLNWLNRAWLPHTVQPAATASARFWAATTALAPGLRYQFGAVELELGLALQAGVIHGAGADIDSPAQAWAPWYALAPSLAVGLELGRGVRVVLGQEFVLTPVPPEFEIAPIGTVYRTPVVTPVTTLSVPLDVARF